ncbi:hypothetical protein BJ684DRAFT_15388 [Piptocephalis cylindrospora]|uniref:Uncharacterized protein n=1 Tax=Piptocephalis cylindrospora TaxID=1907219 RepID=A0A4P9Y5P1_9FUNG|nr:hypothetical protein BJ684DRAFT_15388 [Piptocephalis cylindrospora]|eukprot:RKP14275.1 hypothetical protein BJ684DRAFT_15388 [Piptocephalis cylindrospora]
MHFSNGLISTLLLVSLLNVSTVVNSPSNTYQIGELQGREDRIGPQSTSHDIARVLVVDRSGARNNRFAPYRRLPSPYEQHAASTTSSLHHHSHSRDQRSASPRVSDLSATPSEKEFMKGLNKHKQISAEETASFSKACDNIQSLLKKDLQHITTNDLQRIANSDESKLDYYGLPRLSGVFMGLELLNNYLPQVGNEKPRLSNYYLLLGIMRSIPYSLHGLIEEERQNPANSRNKVSNSSPYNSQERDRQIVRFDELLVQTKNPGIITIPMALLEPRKMHKLSIVDRAIVHLHVFLRMKHFLDAVFKEPRAGGPSNKKMKKEEEEMEETLLLFIDQEIPEAFIPIRMAGRAISEYRRRKYKFSGIPEPTQRRIKNELILGSDNLTEAIRGECKEVIAAIKNVKEKVSKKLKDLKKLEKEKAAK